MVKKFILSTLLLLLPMVGLAQTCEQLFAISSGSSLPEALLNKSAVSDWKILKAARADILGDRSLAQKVRDQVGSLFDIFRAKQKNREQIEIEIRRRNFKAALEKMGVQTQADPLYWLHKNKHYFSLLFSIAANSGANYLSYHFAGHPVLVHLPVSRMFKPEEVPDYILAELLTNDAALPLTRKYVVSRRGRQGADLVINNIRRYFNIGIMASLTVFSSQITLEPLLYPEQFINTQLVQSRDAVNSYALQSNLELQEKLEIKKELFEKSGQSEKAAAAEKIIKQIDLENKQLNETFIGEKK